MTKQKVREAAQRSAERALREERLGLAAIAKVFVLEVPEPGRLLARLEAMARAAEANPKTPLRLRQTLLDGAQLVRTAIEREVGRPQTLMDPDVGHVNPDGVDRLVDGHRPDQLGLLSDDGGLQDSAGAHAERVRVLTAVHEGLVAVLRYGPATDEEIVRRYKGLKAAPTQSAAALLDRRKELTAAGRVCLSGQRRQGRAMWELVEQEELTTLRREQ